MNKAMIAATAAVFFCVPGIAAAQGFDGVRGEVRIGYETPTVSDDGDVYKIGSAVSYGGEVGYDAKLGSKTTLGAYATYEFSSVELCDGPDCLKVDNNLGVGARVGFTVGPKAQLYGKLGYARMKITADTSFGSGSDTQGGVQGALGVAFNLSAHTYASLEASYADYGDFYGINLQRRHVAAGLGFRF